jgi:hypothetical protein
MTKPIKEEVWVIVRHSAYGYKGDLRFAQGLELRAMSDPLLVGQITLAGGKVCLTYTEADEYAFREAYPKTHMGMVPRAPGMFHRSVKIDGLAVYLPPKGEPT